MKDGLFFERMKTQRGEWPQAFRRDIFPENVRQQCWQLWGEFIPNYEWKTLSTNIVRKLRYRIGVSKLNNHGYVNDAFGEEIPAADMELKGFFLKGISDRDAQTNVEYSLSALELMCQFLKNKSDDVIDEINFRLRLAGVGFKFIGDALAPVDDENLTDSAVLPAISLLNRPEFASAYSYLTHAFNDYRSGSPKALETAIDNIQKSAEALMKTIFDDLSIKYEPKDSYKRLIQIAKEKGLFPDVESDKLNPLMNNLQTLGEIRNRGGGHGTPSHTKATDRLVRLAIHHATADMLFIAESYLELKDSKASEAKSA